MHNSFYPYHLLKVALPINCRKRCTQLKLLKSSAWKKHPTKQIPYRLKKKKLKRLLPVMSYLLYTSCAWLSPLPPPTCILCPPSLEGFLYSPVPYLSPPPPTSLPHRRAFHPVPSSLHSFCSISAAAPVSVACSLPCPFAPAQWAKKGKHTQENYIYIQGNP